MVFILVKFVCPNGSYLWLWKIPKTLVFRPTAISGLWQLPMLPNNSENSQINSRSKLTIAECERGRVCVNELYFIFTLYNAIHLFWKAWVSHFYSPLYSTEECQGIFGTTAPMDKLTEMIYETILFDGLITDKQMELAGIQRCIFIG